MHDVGVGFPDILTGKVQEHAFASFRIFQDDASGIRQMQFHRVCDADGDEVMLEVELPQGGFIVLTPEVTDHDDHGRFFLGKDKLPGYIGNVLVGSIVFTGYDFADDAQGLLDSLGRGDVMGVAVPVDEEAAFVSALGSAVGEHCRYFRRIVQFGDAGRGGGVVHGAADVHRQNDGLFPFLPETADKRGVHPGRYLPVNEAGVVSRHVFPEVVKVQPLSAEAGLVLPGEVFRGQMPGAQFNAAYALENV